MPSQHSTAERCVLIKLGGNEMEGEGGSYCSSAGVCLGMQVEYQDILSSPW
jgi:hypothetical protein